MRSRLIICGWYRDENAHWVPQLTRHLEAYRHQHDFVHVMGATTKAEQALAAMGRHPGHVIAMVDADCRARGTLEELAHIRADVAMFMRPKPFRGRDDDLSLPRLARPWWWGPSRARSHADGGTPPGAELAAAPSARFVPIPATDDQSVTRRRSDRSDVGVLTVELGVRSRPMPSS